jgi:HAD superfamily hydrolase (TIGR01549 family)
MLHNIKGIIFDFDGTLFDNFMFGFNLIAANPLNMFRVWKERLIRKRFAGRDFMTPENYYRVFFAEMGKICLRSPEQIRNWYFNRYMPRMVRVIRNHYQYRPGVQELFRRVEAQGTLRLAVYSDYPLLKERMEALGLCPSPAIPLYSPGSFGAQKPAARPFLRIARDLGVAPKEVLVIGDRDETDGLGAFNAGMRFFRLETGRQRYYSFDPYRRRPADPPHGPSLVMYAGTWDNLIKVLMAQHLSS